MGGIVRLILSSKYL